MLDLLLDAISILHPEKYVNIGCEYFILIKAFIIILEEI